ncbi:MAG: tripartite tricarboxylate transporter substrate binding protein [Hyphomicrobiaceae bacterium]|nr:tripartite tricarboxylate transporter substrate binding protein [Hyphomicrobiaceae bacterium]
MTMTTRRRFVAGSAAGLLAAPFAATGYAQAWPSKPIRIICAYPAGGLTDLFARAYGEFLQAKLGQTVTVENRSGASGSLGARAVKAAEPDGYTLMFTISTALLQNRVLLKNPGYDGDNDFVRIAHMSAGHLPTVAGKQTGIQSVKDLVAYAKTNNVSFGTFGAGSYAHITAGVLNKLFGLNMRAVHYRGEAPMWQDIAAGSIQLACGSYAAAHSVITGNLGVPIAVPTLKRMSRLPDVPTYHEQGAADPAFEVSGFICLVGPAGMPQDIVNRLSDLMVEAGRSERVRKINDTFGIDEAALSRQEFEKIYARNGPILIQLVRDLNLAQMDAQ